MPVNIPIRSIDNHKKSSFRLFPFLMMTVLISVAIYLLTNQELIPSLGVSPLVITLFIASLIALLAFCSWSLWLLYLKRGYLKQKEILNQEFSSIVGSSSRPKEKAYAFKRIGEERKALDSCNNNLVAFRKKTLKPIMFLAMILSSLAFVASLTKLSLFF